MTDSRHFFEWTPERIALLTQLWAEGLTGTQIGARMKITKSSAIGKAQRLKLPARAISHRKPPKPFAPARAPFVQRPVSTSRLEEYSSMPTVKKPCQFPMWGDEKPTHEYCGKDRVEGKPYCASHCARAFVKVASSLVNTTTVVSGVAAGSRAA